MYEERLPTETWVSAHITKCSSLGIPVYVTRRGSEYGGSILLKLLEVGKGCRILSQIRNIDGELGWMHAIDAADGKLVEERDADDYIKRSIERDPDIWVIEAEVQGDQNPFEGKIFE